MKYSVIVFNSDVKRYKSNAKRLTNVTANARKAYLNLRNEIHLISAVKLLSVLAKEILSIKKITKSPLRKTNKRKRIIDNKMSLTNISACSRISDI